MSSIDLRHKVKESIRAIDPQARVILFGSKARGDSNASSDWDFLILTSHQADNYTKNLIRDILLDTELEAEQVISSIIFSQDKWHDYQITPLYKNIAKEGVELWVMIKKIWSATALKSPRLLSKKQKSLGESGFWSGAANRLYYCCFYAVTALLAKDDIQASTHNGVRTEFFKQYIKAGVLDRELSSLYSNLMSRRHESDYDDFIEFLEEEIEPLFKEVQSFLSTIRELIEK